MNEPSNKDDFYSTSNEASILEGFRFIERHYYYLAGSYRVKKMTDTAEIFNDVATDLKATRERISKLLAERAIRNTESIQKPKRSRRKNTDAA
jgi:hypothetical protein